MPNSNYERVVIGIDPHKASWTAAAVNSALQPVATIRVPVTRAGYRSLRKFAAQWPAATWAIEGVSGLGAPLNTWLAADQLVAVDVPAKLATRVRMLSTGHGRKTDDADATSVGIAALTAVGLRTAGVDEAITVLRALSSIAMTSSRPGPKRSTGCTCCSPGYCPAGRHATSTPTPQPNSCGPSDPAKPGSAPYGSSLSNWSPRSVTSTDASTAANTKIAEAVQHSGSTLTDLRWHRDPDRREDPGPRRERPPVPLAGGLRLLHRDLAHRGLLRRRRTSSALPRGRPTAQLLPTHHGHHPNPPQTDPAGPTTNGNEPTAKATKKPCAA